MIYDELDSMFWAANIYGYSLSVFVYVKALYFPTHKEDCKYGENRNFLWDFFMGVEMNPRIGSFDFKLFHNGRPGELLEVM